MASPLPGNPAAAALRLAPKKARSLPLVLCGERHAAGADQATEIRSGNGEDFLLPTLTSDSVTKILGQDRFLLRNLPLQEIIAFLRNVGHNWKSHEYARRRIYIRQLQEFLGYSAKMAEHEANWIAMLLSSQHYFYDVVACELGSRHILDHWIHREEAEVRAFPRGRSLHILSGNVPLAGVGSVLRALITKNVCVVKASSADPITPASIALSFLDVDPTHPVARAMSVVYWSGGEDGPLIRHLVRDMDVICAWGGAEAMDWATRHVGPETELLRFGPKRSLAVVGADADVEKAARALAHDVCVYDQRGCFSIQQVFVEVPLEQFLPALERALALYATLLPKGFHDDDEQARCSLSLLEASFLGRDVRQAPEQAWAVVVGPPERVESHPLGRVLFVHPVEHVADALPYISSNVQTVAVYPWALAGAHRDAIVRAGACRIVELGLNNVFRQGGAHDGMFPLQRLVRVASTELSGSVYPKSMTIPLDQTKFLEENRFLEFVP